VTAWVAPRGAGLLIELLTIRASRRRASAGCRRAALCRTVSHSRPALLAQGASSASAHTACNCSAHADRGREGRPAARLLVDRRPVGARSADSQIADATFERVTGAADGRSVTSRWRSTIGSGTLSRWSSASHREIGTARRCISRPNSRDEFWPGLRDGEIGLSEIAASRLGVAEGGTIELPTVGGPRQYRGRWNLSSTDGERRRSGRHRAGSRTDWRVLIGPPCATRSRWPIRPPPTRPLTAAISSTSRRIAGVRQQQWRSEATIGITRFLEPFTIAGYVVMAAAGLSGAERVRAGTGAAQA